MGRDMYACPIAAGFVLAPSIAWTAKVAVTVVVGQTVVMMMMMTMLVVITTVVTRITSISHNPVLSQGALDSIRPYHSSFHKKDRDFLRVQNPTPQSKISPPLSLKERPQRGLVVLLQDLHGGCALVPV